MGVTRLGPHDLRRSCAKLCHATGGELNNSIPAGSRIGADDRTLSGLQTKDPWRRQRLHRHRAVTKKTVCIGANRDFASRRIAQPAPFPVTKAF
jgi:hypothetical protein